LQEGFDFSGVHNLLEVASFCCKADAAPVELSANCRLNCSVALTKLYDDLGGDNARAKWDEEVQSYIQ